MTISFVGDNSSPTSIIEPATRCISYVGEQMKIGGTVQRALIALAGQKELILILKDFLLESGTPTCAIDNLLREQYSLGDFANEAIDSDFHHLNTSTIISCWSALEVAVEDTLIALIKNYKKTLPLIASYGIPLQNYTLPVDEKSAMKIAGKIEKKARNLHDAGPAFIYMLEIAGFRISCNSNTLLLLTEINAVRNCILHRGGICDSRTISKVKNRNLTVGETLIFSRPLSLNYLEAISDFALALNQGAVNYLNSNPSAAS